MRDAHYGLEFRRVLFRSQGSPTPIISLLSESNAPLQPTDIKIVAYVSEFRPMLAVRNDSPHKDWNEFLDFAKKERKSVEMGKSVSVRVGLGGRRIIKKKTNY